MALREAVTAIVVAIPFGIGAGAAADDPSRVLLSFADPEIVESSGLVAGDGLLYTVNDSGDDARVFVVDPADGTTVGVGRFPGPPVDVEALAPAGPGQVWVGDIGDNSRARDSVRVTRVAVGRGDQTSQGPSHDLVYPDGAHDAEALLAHPRTGRLYVVTKDVLGGRVYAAPRPLGPGPQQLDVVGGAPPLVTDGAFLPDGRHVVLRDYSRAVVLSFPDLDVVGDLTLPPTRQGEGIAVGSDGALLTSTEGVRAPVHRVPLPRSLARAVAGEQGGGRSRDSSTDDGSLPEQPPVERDPWPWLLGGVVGVAMVAVLIRSLRPR